ncbi:MAG: hypothetical protein H6565_12410 [Lewinellaceae bacterium]|nr:hypothetical protein [Lewinellaceae bacterium]
MQKIIKNPILAPGPVELVRQSGGNGSFVMNGLLLLVSIPAAVITFAILVAMLPVRFFGTLLK